ncbi:hypothetical protein K32_08510 [Kaistia sp. 32K]|nr:hypothetical protein K32_08510 [Kaistia sp. 32K]
MDDLDLPASFPDIDTPIEKVIRARLGWKPDGQRVQDIGDYLGTYLPASLATSDRGLAHRHWLVGGLIDTFPFDAKDGANPGRPSEVAFWGCGKRDDAPLDSERLRCSTFLGARGPLTRDSLGLPKSAPLGDPTLLLPLVHTVNARASTAGKTICVPHLLDTSTDAELIDASGVDLVVRPTVEPSFAKLIERIDEIAGASFVLAGSLGAAMIACAYDIPFAFYDNGNIDLPFQWRDFAASVGVGAAFARNVDEGRDIYINVTAKHLRKPPLTAILAAAPFIAATEFILRAIERDMPHAAGFEHKFIPHGELQALRDQQASLVAANETMRSEIDARYQEIAQLRAKIARRERALSYRIAHLPRTIGRAVRPPFVPFAFHENGKPRGWVRKLLFNDRTPRVWARKIVLLEDGRPRPAFHKFIYKYDFSPRETFKLTNVSSRATPTDEAAILICSDMPPMFDQSSGALRLKTLIELTARKQRPIIFCSLFEKSALPGDLATKLGRHRYETALHNAGVTQILYGPAQLERLLDEAEPRLSDAFLSFPNVAETFLPIIREKRPETIILYDMVDFHALRLRREAKLKDDPRLEMAADEMQALEIWLANEADVTIAVTDDEKRELLKLSPLANVRTLPNIFVIPKTPLKGPERRKGLLFVGGFWHTPNVDAVKWFVDEILPLVLIVRPDVHFTIAGSNPDDSVKQLARNPNVSVLGYVEDLSPLYADARICVAPLRFGAGVKGKVGEAMANGLPVVGTSIAFEGMLDDSNDHFLQSDTPEGFAAHILTLLENDGLWRSTQANGRRFIEERFSTEALSAKVESLFQ